MNNIEQCYEILKLNPNASPEEVKQAYKDLAMVWHPDRFPANNPRLKEKAQEELKRINAAYEVLKSHQFSYSANTKSPTPDAKNDWASATNHQPPTPHDKIYYERGMEKAQRGRYKEAIADFLRAISINPNYAEAYKYRGIAHSKLGDNQKAISDLKQAADLYLKQGKIEDYQDVLERLEKLQSPVSYSANTKSPTPDTKTHQASPPNPKPPISADAKSYYALGMHKAKRGRYQEAIADFISAILINPNYAEAYKERGIAHSKVGNDRQAIYDLKQAADLYFKQGNTNDYQDVLEWLKKLQQSESIPRKETPESVPKKETQSKYEKIYRLFPDF